MKRMRLKPLVLALAFSLTTAPAVSACTLWAAANSAVAGGGTLIAKTRDWTPNENQKVVSFAPAKGYRYAALIAAASQPDDSAASRRKGRNTGGINEKGLAVVSASASSIPTHERRSMRSTNNLLRMLLSECASVDEALAKSAFFVGPRFLMLADVTKIAMVEIGDDGKHHITVRDTGTLAHTNHYLAPEMQAWNKRVLPSTRTRLQRITELLAAGEGTPFVMDDFIRMSQDRNAGPDNSIFRTGSKPAGTRTLAVLIMRVAPGQSPAMYVRLLTQGKPEEVNTIRLADFL